MEIADAARQHGIKKTNGTDILDKLFVAYLRKAEEGLLSRILIETTVLLASSRINPAQVLRDAATQYKVDTDAISLKVKLEFAAKAKKQPKPVPKAKKAA